MSRSFPKQYERLFGYAYREVWTFEQKERFRNLLMNRRLRKLRRVSEAQNHRCCFCGRETFMLEEGKPSHMTKNQQATLEHVTPQTHGGTDDWSNLAMSCMSCNTSRGSMDWEKFMELRDKPHLWKEYNRQKASERAKSPEGRAKEARDKIKHEKKLVNQTINAFWLAVMWLYFPQTNVMVENEFA